MNSEATIGKIQARYPQQGYVDHVITPAVGLCWMMAEDAVDKYLITRIEEHTQNRWVKMFARAGLNPSRSMANVTRMELPWHRDTRPGIWHDQPVLLASGAGPSPSMGVTNKGSHSSARDAAPSAFAPPDPEALNADRVPSFELGIEYTYFRLSAGDEGAQSCNGGGATAVWNVNRWVGLVADIGGCKMMSAGHNVSGDSTNYLFGPRITFRNAGRVTPYLQALVGGDKLTTETIYPNKEPSGPEHVIANSDAADELHSLYTSHAETNNFSWQVGGGLDYRMTAAIGLKLAEADYLHVGARDFNDASFHNNFRFSTGLVLRFGTW